MTARYRVGIDGFNLALTQGTGVATYARALRDALHASERAIDLVYGIEVPASAAPPLRETLFFARLGEGMTGGEAPAGRMTVGRAVRRLLLSPATRDMVEVPLGLRVIAGPLGQRIPRCERLFTLGGLFGLGARHFRRYGRFLRIRVPDPPAVMHWTYPLPVRMEGARNLYTVHDLVPLRLPFFSREDKAYHEALLRHCAASADHLVTVSEASRRDVIDHLDIDPARITNTYQALPEATEKNVASIERVFGLRPQGYFLFVGAIEPKKNVGRLIEAYLSSGTDTPLLVVGPTGWDADAELRLIGSGLSAADRIRRLHHLPETLLHPLIAGARALLCPSLYEGFGLPALEAMTAGVPVMAGNAGSLPEIVGASGLLVQPLDIAAMADAIVRLDRDAALRTRLASAGMAAADRWSMVRYRERLDALHARLLGNAPTPVATAGSISLPNSVPIGI